MSAFLAGVPVVQAYVWYPVKLAALSQSTFTSCVHPTQHKRTISAPVYPSVRFIPSSSGPPRSIRIFELVLEYRTVSLSLVYRDRANLGTGNSDSQRIWLEKI